MTRKSKELTPTIAIPKPTPKGVEKHLKEKFGFLDEHYAVQQDALNTLFFQYPKNNRLTEVMLKVCVLNDFYSTNIFSIYSVAKRIVDLKIDKRLETYDKDLINDIAKVEIKGKNRNFYSFATKYCVHHNPNDYLIYDSYVEKMLVFFQKRDNFYGSKLPDLKQFDDFRNVVLKFQDFYDLKIFCFREIDKYLWTLGKEAFQKNYKKKQKSSGLDKEKTI